MRRRPALWWFRGLCAGLVLLMQGCEQSVPAAPPLFERLEPTATGVSFRNTLPERPEFNILNYLYYFNGGGVAVGDVDNDGLQDLYLSSNLDANRLYRNKGNYQFEDITDRAGVAGPPGWKTGVTMADVNGDGSVDIYVSAVHYLSMAGHNVLYINDGDGTFTDRTTEYGLDNAGYSTQAAFFDYDGDGDLDMYMLNNSTHSERGIDASQRGERGSPAADRLYRNDGGHFIDVSVAAGIVDGVGGFGLGVVVTDYNLDGCPDLYVSNDFQENDFLYRNNCDGTFTESITTATRHTSRFSMGVDAADFNNDGRPDIFVADMLPEREEIFKSSASYEGFNLFEMRLRAGYHPQYPRNTLQLNRGNGRFSEIGYQAGVFASDWSWAPLFADLDNDGRKDLFITSGIFRRPNDLDYINYVGNEAVQASLAAGISDSTLSLLKRMPQIPLPNHAFRNDGEYHFTDMAESWGLGDNGFSNGAAYVDLNNSGALDLVVNKINAPAAIYRNRARERNGFGYLTVTLHGADKNSAGIGARVTLGAGGFTQMLEQSPTRGFQSSVDPRLHFGVGAATSADSLVVTWPGRRLQVLRNIPLNRTITLYQDSAAGPSANRVMALRPIFTDVSAERHAAVVHGEQSFLDYDREPLMPHLLSTQGPALAGGDVNGDGRDDLYVGGAKWQQGQLLLQQKDGTFASTPQPAIAEDSLAEDVDAVLFDADGDGDLDLYVVSAGNEFWGDADALRDRLYVNDGHGAFSATRDALPPFFENGGCVVAGDYDKDGDIDLFVGSRVVSRAYGSIPRSHLLRNEGNGRFTDVTREVAPGLERVGMVSAAAWVDTDGDGSLDLVVTGEWMPVRVFRQAGGQFIDRTTESGLAGSEGWWNTVTVADVNADGTPDLVLGNLGLNSYLRASDAEHAALYLYDFFGTGSVKQILTFYKHGTSYPLAGRDELLKLMPPLRSKFQSYAAFGASTVQDIFPASELARATVLRARTFAHAVAINDGRGGFRLQPLAAEAQFAPVYGALADDFDSDGVIDLLLAGDFYGVPPVIGRYDASYGLILRGVGGGRFAAMDMVRSGLLIDGEARHVRLLRDASGGRLVAVARSGGSLQLWKVAK